MKNMNCRTVEFVLVRPSQPGNIGSAARAIKVMGFNRLSLIDPQCSPHDKMARLMAHGSGDVLENARVLSALDQVEADLMIGTTARQRNVRSQYMDAAKLPADIRDKGETTKHTAIVFGSEESGLSNAELLACHLVSHVPLATAHPSMNLAQAVMVYSYILSGLTDGKQANEDANQNANVDTFAALTEKADHLVHLLGKDKSPAFHNRLKERMALLKEEDVRLAHSLLSELLKRLG